MFDHVLVDDGRVVPVQEGECLGPLRDGAENGRGCQPGCALLRQQTPEIGPVDPVHHDDVLVFVEKVVAHERQACVRLEREEDPSPPAPITSSGS